MRFEADLSRRHATLRELSAPARPPISHVPAFEPSSTPVPVAVLSPSPWLSVIAVGGSRICNQPSIDVEAHMIDADVVKRELLVQLATPTARRWRHGAVSYAELCQVTNRVRARWCSLALSQMSIEVLPDIGPTCTTVQPRAMLTAFL